MKIYSIKEIVKATNSFLNPETKTLPKKSKKIKNIKLPPETESIIAEAESTILDKNKKRSLSLNNEVLNVPRNSLDSFNYKIKIKPEVKDHMINELYLYLKKKVRKSTLKLIIDEQLEIKNLRNKVNILKQNKNLLMNNYQSLEKKYDDVLKNYNEIKIDKTKLDKNFHQISNQKDELADENSELKIDKKELQDNLIEIGQLNKKLISFFKLLISNCSSIIIFKVFFLTFFLRKRYNSFTMCSLNSGLI